MNQYQNGIEYVLFKCIFQKEFKSYFISAFPDQLSAVLLRNEKNNDIKSKNQWYDVYKFQNGVLIERISGE